VAQELVGLADALKADQYLLEQLDGLADSRALLQFGDEAGQDFFQL
jgi:hypothetical protein